MWRLLTQKQTQKDLDVINNNIPTRKQPAEESPAKLFKCYNGGLSVGKQFFTYVQLNKRSVNQDNCRYRDADMRQS